jgi:hypothetical protein
VVLLESALALLLGLPLQLALVGLLVEGLLLGAEHVGDELVAGVFGVGLAF